MYNHGDNKNKNRWQKMNFIKMPLLDVIIIALRGYGDERGLLCVIMF